MATQIWNRLQPGERLIAIGSGLILAAWVIGIVLGGGIAAGATDTIGLLGALAALGVLVARYAPNAHVTWPAQPEVILLVDAAIVALVTLLELLWWLPFIAYFGAYLLPALLSVAGAVSMAAGAYRGWAAARAA